MKHIKNKLIRSGHTPEEADLLVNNMYYLIRILIENLDRNAYEVSVDFYVVNAPTELATLDILLERLR